MTIKVSNEIAMELLASLGMDGRRVSEVNISLKANEAPVVEVIRYLNEAESNQFLMDLKRYELMAREVENG